jgi:hypothetical protein
VDRNPAGYELVLSENKGRTGENDTYAFRIVSSADLPKGDVHVFITNYDLHVYSHQKALRNGDGFNFAYKAPSAGKYRMEVVFETAKGWVNLRKDLKLSASPGEAPEKLPGDEDYQVKLKLIPKKAYAEHVATFLYEIFYKGAPVKDLDKIDGFDMQAAAWDEDLKEFIYMTPKQNLGGPEVAVSFVFMRPGKHAVFAEFSHKGVVRRIESVVLVHQELLHDRGAIENLRPAD